MLKISEIFEFSKEHFRKIPILKEFEWFEWFEWFGPSPIEPFNSDSDTACRRGTERRHARIPRQVGLGRVPEKRRVIRRQLVCDESLRHWHARRKRRIAVERGGPTGLPRLLRERV